MGKPFDEWTEEEAAMMVEYENEQARLKEERDREKREREAYYAQKTSEYWRMVHENTSIPSLSMFEERLRQTPATLNLIRIPMTAEQLYPYILAAYKFECSSVSSKEFIHDSSTETILKTVSKWLTSHTKPSLMLRGYVGTGKTTLARAIKQCLITLAGKQMRLDTASALSTMYKDNKELFNSLKKAECLIIDDLGTEPTTLKNYGNEDMPLSELLTERYERRLFTIITTNLTINRVDGKNVDEIETIYGVRIADRLREMCNTISYNPGQKSYRQ